MSQAALSWEAYLEEAPDRVVEVIEDGPFPYVDYGGSKLTRKDKRMGLVLFKGGDGRGHICMKPGMAAIVYFDPHFCEGKYQIEGRVPDEVQERHAKANVLEEFKKL